MAEPAALMLLPRTLRGFIQYDQAIDLLRSPGVVAAEPRRWLPYGVHLRAPAPLSGAAARVQAALTGARGRDVRCVMIFHPVQLPVAERIAERSAPCELWYYLWDRYEHALDARGRRRERLARLHRAAIERADFVFAVSRALVDEEAARGREVALVPSAADSFPAPPSDEAVIAVSLGNLGARVDWSLLREVAQRMPELVVLMVGRVDRRALRGDGDFAACEALPNFVWLGWRPDEEAARLILCADAMLLPFKVQPFNQAALPNRALKAARLGRPTITPPLEGVQTWSRAVRRADGPGEWVSELRALRGTRAAPDGGLRKWAFEQTAERTDAPLWERLAKLGIAPPAER